MKSAEAVRHLRGIIDEAFDYFSESGGGPAGGRSPLPLSRRLEHRIITLLENAFITNDPDERLTILLETRQLPNWSVAFDRAIARPSAETRLILTAGQLIGQAINRVQDRTRYRIGTALWITSYLVSNSYINRLHQAFRQSHRLNPDYPGLHPDWEETILPNVSEARRQVTRFLNRVLSEGEPSREERTRVENTLRAINHAEELPTTNDIGAALGNLHGVLTNSSPLAQTWRYPNR